MRLHNQPLDLAKIMLSATFVDCFTADMVTVASGVWVTFVGHQYCLTENGGLWNSVL